MSHQVVWSWPVVAEQFFIGLGAGAFFVAALLHLFAREKHDELIRVGFYVSPIATAIGIVVLDLELGRPERGLNALLNPGTSMISRGSYGIMLFLAITVVTAAAWAVPSLPKVISGPLTGLANAVKRPAEIAGLAVSIFAGLYAGLQIGWAVQRQFWFTPFLPWLYFVSALSMGFAIMCLLALLRRKQAVTSFIPRVADYVIYLIVAQALIIAAHFATTEGAAAEITALFSPGFYLPALLIGVFIVGMIGPVVLCYLALRSGSLAKGRSLLLLLLLIVGGFSIRAVFLFAGQVV